MGKKVIVVKKRYENGWNFKKAKTVRESIAVNIYYGVSSYEKDSCHNDVICRI